MELHQYVNFARKWLWWIALITFIAGCLAYATSIRHRDPYYETEIMLAIGNYANSPDPQASDIYIGRELVKTYIILATTHNVLQATIDELGLDMTVDHLRASVFATPIEDTSLLSLTITDTDRVRAADIANELANQIILHSPTNLTPEQQKHIDLANMQIERLNDQLEGLHVQLGALDERIDAATGDAELRELTLQRNTLIDQINEATTTVAQYSYTVLSLQGRSNSVEIIEPAEIPTRPLQTSPLNRTLFGALAGAALAVGIALVRDYMDTTLKTSARTAEVLKKPVWGTIHYTGRRQRKAAQLAVIPSGAPGHEVQEAYHTLRTNILLASSGPHVYAVTSPGPAEGKSTVAANLAIAMAQSGKRVLLVDADLRRPTVHRYFGLPNEFGLGTLLQAIDPAEDPASGDRLLVERIAHCVQSTAIPNLVVVTSGSTLSQSPSVLLGSPMMDAWFKAVTNVSQLDVVLFDTPPSLMFADGSALAATTGAGVLLVVEAGRTREAAALKVAKTLAEQRIDLKGVILNKARPHDDADYYYYQYRYYYASETEPLHRRLIGRGVRSDHD